MSSINACLLFKCKSSFAFQVVLNQRGVLFWATRGTAEHLHAIVYNPQPEEYFIPQSNFFWNIPSERSINGILYRSTEPRLV